MEKFHATNADASMVENMSLKDANESDAMDIDGGDGKFITLFQLYFGISMATNDKDHP